MIKDLDFSFTTKTTSSYSIIRNLEFASMTNPKSDTDEQIILDSSSISIKGIDFRVILTNHRIALYNSSTQKQNDITLSEIRLC